MREHESREPFAYIIQDKYERERGIEGHLSRSHVSKYVSQEDINEHEITCTPLYRHAQQPVVDADDNFYSWFGREWQENYQHNQYTTAAKQMLGVMAESAWKAGHRTAMLQASPVCTCPSGDGSLRWPCPVHAGNSLAIGIDVASGPDRTVEVRYVAPPGYVMVPVEPNGDMLAAAQDAYGETDGDIASTLRAAMLAAAPQETNS